MWIGGGGVGWGGGGGGGGGGVLLLIYAIWDRNRWKTHLQQVWCDVQYYVYKVLLPNLFSFFFF